MSPATPETQIPDNSISEAQLTANRQNAQKSTGPKTEEGKKRCRLNATRHDLTGQFHAFSHEDKRAFDKHCTSLMADFEPQTYREQSLAMSIAENTWRLNRGRALENNIFALGISGAIGETTDADSPEVHAAACQARVWLQDGKSLQLLTLYESRIRRNIQKDRKELAEIQAVRQAAYDKALEQEKLLAQLALMNNEPYEPAASGHPQANAQLIPTQGPLETQLLVNGSEFSAPQIYRLLRTDQRLHEAAF